MIKYVHTLNLKRVWMFALVDAIMVASLWAKENWKWNANVLEWWAINWYFYHDGDFDVTFYLLSKCYPFTIALVR